MRRQTSIGELEALRDLIVGDRPEIGPTIVINAGTCGQASGANDLIRAAKREILRQQPGGDVGLRITGCHGFCQMEPSILVEPSRTFYPRVKAQQVPSIMKAAAAGQPISVDPAFVPIARAVDTPGALDVLYRRAIYARETGEGQDFGSAVELHSVNVAIYALKIGEGLRYNRDQLIDLGVAALVHDVGMVTLPPDFFSKGELSKQDIEILHQHPQKAHDILIQLGENYKWLAEVALEEHEREDGSGYPNGLSGSQIHEYARIIGVADMYAGLTRSRQDRRGRLPFEAVKEILQSQKTKFDTRIVRILLSKLSAFPIGSLVRLNSGAIGQVTETDETNQLRPVIRIIQDAHGRRVDDERIINLREFPILHITDVIYEEDLEQSAGR